MKKVLVIDNYDSFTYNLVQLIKNNSTCAVTVIRNDKVKLEKVQNYAGIIFSPGPGIPNEAGLMPQVLEKFHNSKPMLGVCLGHQCIGEFFNSPLKNLDNVFHGKSVPVNVLSQNDLLYQDVPKTFAAGRYHSWVIDRAKISPDLEVTAEDEHGLIMSIKHRSLPVYGVQYHPESVMTECGQQILNNWLSLL